MTSNLEVTSDQEQAPQTEGQTATPPGELPKWVVRLFGLGLLAMRPGVFTCHAVLYWKPALRPRGAAA